MSKISQELLHLRFWKKNCTNIMFDFLYYVRQNQHPPAYRSLYLSIFHFFSWKSITNFSPVIKASLQILYMPSQWWSVRENQDAEIYFFCSSRAILRENLHLQTSGSSSRGYVSFAHCLLYFLDKFWSFLNRSMIIHVSVEREGQGRKRNRNMRYMQALPNYKPISVHLRTTQPPLEVW